MPLQFIDDFKRDDFDDTRLWPVLKAIMILTNGYSEYKYGKSLWVTSLFRSQDSGVHGCWRGIDCDNGLLSPEELTTICTYINWLFEYDPHRPEKKCAIYHTVDKDQKVGWHIHLQVHERTKLRGE